MGFIIRVFDLMLLYMTAYHVFLMFSNLTTWEYVSRHRISYLKKYPPQGSPFSRSVARNVVEYCCGARWCPARWRKFAGVTFDETGGVLWEPGEVTPPCWLLKAFGEWLPSP